MTKPVCHFDTATFVNVRDLDMTLQGTHAIVYGVHDHPRINAHAPFICTSAIIRKWKNQHGEGFETANTIYKSKSQKDALEGV